MTVEITQEEMNILNLNGISAEDVRANVEFSRASGLDDNAIRQQFTNTLNELKPTTKTSFDDAGKIKEWQEKGAMTPFELANRTSMYFNGKYDNIDNSANLTNVGKALKNSSRNQLVEDRIENQKREKEARDERVNNGSASFFDRVGSALDRFGKNVYNAQLESAELNKNRQGVDESDSTKRYEVVGIDRAGQPIYNEIDLLQKIDFREGMAETLPKGIAIGAIAEGFDIKKEREIKDKILKGEAIRQDELDFINRRIDFEQEKKVRGYSIGGKIGSGVGYSLGFSADLLTGSALFKALGAGAIGTTLTTNISNVAKGNQALQTAGKAIGWGTNRLAETALTTIVNSPSRLFQGYQERMLNNEMKLTDNGNAVFSISQEKPATALFKSLQSIFVEYFTEIAGGEILRYAAKPIAKAGGKVAQAVENSLIKNLFAKYPKVETLIKNSADVFSKKFEEFNNLKVVGQSREWIKNQVHFDGFLEEMGEEALADVLNLALETNNEERSFENYLKAVFKTPEEWAVIAGAIAIQGAGLSMVGASVANNMAKNGATVEEIQTVLENLTENELRDLQAEQIAEGSINVDETEEQHFEKTVNTVADYLIDSGKVKDRNRADKIVRLAATMLNDSIGSKTGKSLDDLMAEDMAEINETEDYGVVDENGVLVGSVSNTITLDSRMNELLDQIDAFTDDTNAEDIDKVVSEISLLENLQTGEVSIEDVELANDLIAAFEEEGNVELANLIRTALDDASAGNVIHYQTVATAGAEGSAEISAAKKEWKEKGTESSYFKKWFGDSKIVDENGKPRVVYHGSLWNFDTFGKSEEFDFSLSPKFAYEYAGQKSFEQGLDLSPVMYQVYLKVDKPFDFRNEDSVNELFEKIGDKEINFYGNKYSKEKFKDFIMGLAYENTVSEEDFKKAEIGMAYSRWNENVEEKMSSVATDRIVYKNNKYFIALSEIEEPRKSPFESEPAGRVDREDVYKQIEKLAKDIDFGEEYTKKITINTNLLKTTYEYGKGYVTEKTPYEYVAKLKKIDNPKYAKKGSGYDNWSFMETAKIGDLYFIDFLKENGYDGYYKQEKEQVNISVFDPKQIKAVSNQGTFDADNPNIYYQAAYHGTPHKFEEFSTEHIGSGEGAQAHGWGLYFAANKNISEDYRKRLVDDNVSVSYENKTYSIDENFGNALYKIKRYGLDKTIEFFQEKENEFKEQATTSQNPEWWNREANNFNELVQQIKNVQENKIEINEGQLFEVDIPENNVLLDEDKTYLEQTKEVQEAYKKAFVEIYKDINFIDFKSLTSFTNLEEIFNTEYTQEAYERFQKNALNYIEAFIPEDLTGKVLYQNLSKKLGSARNASLKLNEFGIKGLTYDGKQDGRCYVIFDDKAVEVVQTYYQSENKTLLDGFREVLKNIINNNQKKEMFTVSELLPHIPAFSRIRNFFNGIENVKVELVSDTKNEFKNGYYRASDDTVRINKDALYVSEMPLAAIETLLHELQHAHQKRNYDKYKNILAKNLNLSEATKERLQNYIDNYEAMKDATKAYRDFKKKNAKQLAQIDAMKKQLGKEKLIAELSKKENINLFIIYNEANKIYNEYKNSSGEVEARTVAINLIYQMGYGEIYDNQRRSLLSSFGNSGQLNGSRLYGSRSSGRIGRNGYNNRGRSETNRYFQSDSEDSEGTENISGRSLGDSTQQKIFIDNQQAEVLRDRYQKVKGSFIPAENLITLFKDADESTIVHEFAHWWLDKLVKYAEENEEIAEDLKEIRKFVRNNGEAFTTEQHEKFARGFEAYIRTGSAKTNRLKRLFEDFKNALLSLYDSIKNLGFSEDEMPQINNLFERLLTTENQRIQAAVFDRCDKLQEQIQEIRDNQEKELAEIDEIYQNNLERNLKDNKKKQQVNEYIRLAQKSASRIPKAVREYQDRYKQATLEILEVATGYKRQFIANPRNWETIEQKIADLSDEITSGDGMRDNWREFYFDTGVSYDNEEIDGDYKLAEQAFKVLTSGNYSQAKADVMDDEEIGKFFGMFDYLKGKVLSLRGENKDAAYEALTSIFNNMPSMPNEAVQELVDDLQKIGEQFLDQKAMESPSKFSIPNVSASVQFRAYVISKLHNMKVYDPESKRVIRLSSVNKLYNILKYANSVLDTKEIIRKINAHAILQLENRQKHILDREIQKQVRINSKLVKVGALKKGKFDWKTNTIFSELVQMNRLNMEDARKEYTKLTQAEKIEIGEERESWDENPTESLAAPTDFQAALKIKFLEYKSNKTNDRNLLATRSLLEDIIELKFEGRRAKNEEELKKNLSRYNYETNLVEILNKHRYNGKAKFLAKWVTGETWLTSEGTLANWESILTTVFNKETAAKYSLLKDESDAEVFAYKKCAEFYDKAAEIYHFEKPKRTAQKVWKTIVDFNNVQPLANLFREYENEMSTVIQITYNKDTNSFVETNVEISRAEIITLYGWSLNKELKQRLITQYGQEQLKEMFSKLSDEDKQFAWLMVDICDSMYEESNEVFIRTTGLSLPRLENYIPSKTERVGSDIDMLHEHIVRSTNPSFIKSRKNCKRIKMDPQTPFAIILPHINKTARYIVLSEKVNFYNRIFASNDIQATLIDIYGKKTGKKIHQVLLNQLGTSTYANYAKSVTVGRSLLDQVASNYITSRIGGNLKVMLSQLTGLINYAENMPAGEWAKGFAKAVAHPKATVKYMFENCDYLKARIAGNSINEVLSTVTNEIDKFRSLRNFCISNTKFGDVLTLCLGGKPYIDYLIKQGMSKEEAFKKYVEDTLRSQQSGHNSATSAWQKKQAETPINRMVFAFNNTNLQFERKFVEALSNYAKKDISTKEFAKAIVIYKILNPVLFSSFLTNLSLISLFRAFSDGDDDEVGAFGVDILEAMALANLKAYGLLGIIADCLGRFVFSKIKKERYFSTQLPLISDIEEQVAKIAGKEDLALEDYITALCVAGDYTTGIAATRVKNSLGGFENIIDGDYGTGLLRLLGYGEYRASVAATGEKPKK